MNEMLKALYDSFYEKVPATQLKAEIERCHQELIEKLDKPERRLVLQIIDCKDQITEDLSRPSQTLCKPPMWCRIEAPHWR